VLGRRAARHVGSGVFLVLVFAGRVAAASVNVALNDDSTNVACATNGIAPCSLRDAVTYANTHDDTTIYVRPTDALRHRAGATVGTASQVVTFIGSGFQRSSTATVNGAPATILAVPVVVTNPGTG
jgi:hypothetical protein